MSESPYPRMFRIRQLFQAPRLERVEQEVESQLARLALAERIRPGQTVAITAGSRGIANIHLVMRGIVQHLKSIGAAPFIVPAMGSHGGGTAEGQRAILEGYGITESYCGCPIRSSMETVVVCQAAEGFPVHFDKHAYEADHVVVCGRVKPHTGFHGDLESGLMKMMLIGLGKHNGAKIYHRAIKDHSFGQIVRSVAREVLSQCGIVAGVAIVENSLEQTALIEAVAPDQFEEREKALLIQAKSWLAGLPFRTCDLLLIDEIGKNISGTGMDTNVVGRKFLDHRAADDEHPKIRNIAIRGLTEATHGNGTGLGLAEFCLSRVLRQLDVSITRINCLTGGHVTGAMLPLDYESDREILDAALSVIGLKAPRDAEVMWIANTLEVAQLACSEAYYDEAQGRSDLEVLSEPAPMAFDSDGRLLGE